MRSTSLYSEFEDAVLRGTPQRVQEYIDLGVDIHKYDDKAFRLGARNGRTENCALLIENGVNPDNALALQWAARDKRRDTVVFLISKGADYRHLLTEQQEEYKDVIEAEFRKRQERQINNLKSRLRGGKWKL